MIHAFEAIDHMSDGECIVVALVAWAFLIGLERLASARGAR